MTAESRITMPYATMPAPDVVDLLLEQHMRARDLMRQVIETQGDDRRDAFRALVHLLAVHEVGEEEVVHPVARRHQAGEDDARGADTVDARLHEEDAAKKLLAELDGSDVDDPQFLPRFLRMREAVLTHALYEQRYEFNRLRHRVGPTERAAMRALLVAAEKTAPTHPHRGPESATGNLLAGPPLAVMDRARDAIRRVRDDG